MKTLILAALAILVLVGIGAVGTPPDDLVERLTDAVRKHCPDASIDLNEGFAAMHGTMVYTIHSVSKTGEVSERTYQRKGPNYKGFMLNVSLRDGKYEGAAATPQTLHEHYFATFVDAVPADEGQKYYEIRFSFGSQIDPGLKDAIFAALPGHASRKLGAGATQAQPAADHADKPPVLKTGIVPIGSLGHPLGSYLTLEGKRADGFKTGVRTLIVEKINGVALDKPRAIWVDNLDLPGETHVILKGYESIRMIGSPNAYVEAMKELGKEALMPQAGWQVQCFFVALRPEKGASTISP
ncbi:MAG: hypothetical protein WD042_01665 [Phycisphaeraceae bacterium]